MADNGKTNDVDFSWTPEMRQAFSRMMKAKYASGEIVAKKMTPEAKAKLSQSMKARSERIKQQEEKIARLEAQLARQQGQSKLQGK